MAMGYTALQSMPAERTDLPYLSVIDPGNAADSPSSFRPLCPPARSPKIGSVRLSLFLPLFLFILLIPDKLFRLVQPPRPSPVRNRFAATFQTSLSFSYLELPPLNHRRHGLRTIDRCRDSTTANSEQTDRGRAETSAQRRESDFKIVTTWGGREREKYLIEADEIDVSGMKGVDTKTNVDTSGSCA